MKKAEFYHRLKQVEYLEQVSHRFEALRLAFIRFNEIWGKDSDFELNLNDYLTTMYPFPKSFDEFLIDFALWYGDGASKIVRAHNEIQPRLSIKEIDDMVEEPQADYEAYKAQRQLEEETDISEQRMREINRLRKIVTNFYAPKYYVVIVRGDVEPELSVKSNTEDERDSLAKQIKRDDSNQEDGIYWLNIVDGLPEIGSYSGAFFEEDNNEIGESKAPYYTKNGIKDKWVCVFRTQYGWDCVRYNGGERDGMPYLYDSKEAVEADQYFDERTDFAYRADVFNEGYNLIYGNDGSPSVDEGKIIEREQESDFNETDSSDEGGCLFWMFVIVVCVTIGIFAGLIGLIIHIVAK